MKEFRTAAADVIDDPETTDEETERSFVVVKLDDREIKFYEPNDGQLVVMMTALARGMNSAQRVATFMSTLLNSMSEEDRDYIEGRLVSSDPKFRITASELEPIFEHVMSEWFGNPTQSQ